MFKEPILVTRPLLPDLESMRLQLEEIWESGWVTNNGEKLKKLEDRLKAHLEAENLSIFCNGTLALIIGLKAMGLKGEVITTPFTYPATTEALDWCGLKPVFCDVEEKTFNIDPALIEARITGKTSAILAVHVFGNPCAVGEIQKIADRHGLKVIYDAAHAFGVKVDGIPISDCGDMTMFSFHATKLFNTIEGGALVFREGALKQKMELMKCFGLNREGAIELSGINAKMNELQAAMGLEVLKLVKEEREKRKAVKRVYENGLGPIPGIRVITKLEDEASSYQYFAIEVDETLYGKTRDDLHAHLKTRNVHARKYFHPLCSDYAWDVTAERPVLPRAEKAVKRVMALPFYGELGTEAAEVICCMIEAYGGHY